MFTLFTRISVLSILIGSSWLRAGIAWEKTEVEVTPKEGEAQVDVPFPFRVKGGQTVQILELGSSCGCTVVALEKRIYAVGESGILTAVFTPGMRQGRQSKQVTVKVTEAGTITETKLTLIVNLPEWAKVSTNRLEWRDDDNQTKTVKIEVKPGVTIVLKKDTTIVPDRFQFELSPLVNGIYTLSAAPGSKNIKGLTPLFVDVFEGQKQVSTFQVLFLRR